jgi:hypothetical protein
MIEISNQPFFNKKFYDFNKKKLYINKPDLIVFFYDEKPNYTNFIKRAIKLKIPIINISHNSQIFFNSNYHSYKISISNSFLAKKNLQGFFFNIISSLLSKKFYRFKTSKRNVSFKKKKI